jgi:hypothetical protein
LVVKKAERRVGGKVDEMVELLVVLSVGYSC